MGTRPEHIPQQHEFHNRPDSHDTLDQQLSSEQRLTNVNVNSEHNHNDDAQYLSEHQPDN